MVIDSVEIGGFANILDVKVVNLMSVTRYASKMLLKLENDIIPAAKAKGQKVTAVCCSYDTDVYYVKHASFFGDLKLIAWTVVAILYTACGKYPQWMHERLVGCANENVNDNLNLNSGK